VACKIPLLIPEVCPPLRGFSRLLPANPTGSFTTLSFYKPSTTTFTSASVNYFEFDGLEPRRAVLSTTYITPFLPAPSCVGSPCI
jgi:hypothetical protein